MIHIFDNPDVDLHCPKTTLPEKPFRTKVIREALHECPEIQDVVIFQHHPGIPFWRLKQLAERVHSESYLTHLADMIEMVEAVGTMESVCGNAESPISPGSAAAILTSTALVSEAVSQTLSGKISKSFCNIRPPGHHACAEKSMGFCLVNNVAIGVMQVLDQKLRVAIVDWDNHHGNGTQDMFYNNPDVMYISLHADREHSYPGTGRAEDKGLFGNVVNINMPLQSGHQEVMEAFSTLVIPSLCQFLPDILFISCGFDGHEADPVGTLSYTSETFHYMTRQLVDFADTFCKGRIISLLEGGYDKRALVDCSIAHVKGLAKMAL